MAQPDNVYDSDADERPVHHSLSKENETPEKSLDNRELKQAESEAGLFNPDGDGGSEDSSKELSESSDSEDSEKPGKPSKRRQLFNALGDRETPLQKMGNRIRGSGKAKWFIGAGVSAGAIGVFLLIFLLFLASSLKIPNLATHIAEYQFAKVLRDSVQNNEAINETKLVTDAMDDSAYARAKARYQGLRDNTWGKLDKYRPAKVTEQLKTNQNFKLVYDKPSLTGRQRLKGVTFNDRSYVIKNPGYTRFIPGLSDAIDFKNGVTLTKDFLPALDEAMKANQIGPVVRGQVSKQIRKELGIGLITWTVGKYQGKNETKARLQLERDINKKVGVAGAADAATPQIKDGAKAAADTLEEDVKDDNKLQQIIDDNGVDKNVTAAITDNVKPSTFDKFLGFANPAFGISLAACTIYDGSLTQSGPTINDAVDSQQKAFYDLGTGGDQQKYGETTGEAVGAYNAKLADYSNSYPEIRAAGGTVDTSSMVSAQASAGGDLSIVGAAFGKTVNDLVGSVGEPACKTLLNPWVAAPTAVAGLLAAILTGGGTGAATAAVDGAASTAASSIATRLVTNVTERFAGKTVSKEAVGSFNAKAREIVGDSTKSAVKVASLTILAKFITMSRANQMNTGLEQGTDYANMSDSGANSNAALLEQRQFAGRPLTKEESNENDSADYAFMQSETAKDSAYERYIDKNNPSSLINRTAIMTANAFGGTSSNRFVSLGNKIISPLSSIKTVFSKMLMPSSIAATTGDNNERFGGNVQFGYSTAEKKHMRGDASYKLLENKKILDDSGQTDAIKAKYGKCFDGSVKIGEMLASGMIVRDTKGNVNAGEGLCAPNNLTFTNNEFGAEMVFRYRVALRFDQALDHATDMQEVTADETSTGDDTTESQAGVKVDTDNLFKDSSKIACADGTKDLGVQDGYANGKKFKIRICAISQLKSTGEESGGGYGVSGADGAAVVNSRVSGAVQAMAKAAKADDVDLTNTVGSAFRTMAHQQALCPCDGIRVARPGFSNHQAGIAIDFSQVLPSSPGPIPGNKVWDWLSKNASKFGYKNYPEEAWHWSPTGH